MSIPNKYKLPVSIAICLLVGFLSGISTSDNISGWYSTLEKPSFNPPNWIFGPVWTFLYILMGIALGKLWSSDSSGKEKNKAIFVFGSQLAVNALWGIFFFGMQNPFLAFIDIIILIILIVYTIKLFKPINRMASWLLYPYLVWVSFAAVLNLSIVVLNR
jgi:tryptophan-rich sensory protein